jgi:DNA topoisomerase-3
MADRLRKWRLEQARARGVPAFRIMTDRTLLEIVDRQPQSIPELLQVHGAGPKLVEKYGAQILRVVAG